MASLYKDARGRWVCDWRDHGKRKRKMFDSKGPASTFKRELEESQDRGTYRAEALKLTVGELVQRWLDDAEVRARLGQIEERTVYNYRIYAKRLINEPIAKLKVNQVSSGTVVRLRDELYQRHRSALVRSMISHLGNAFAFGKQRDLCSDNPASGIRVALDRRTDDKVLVPSREEVGLLIEHAKGWFRPFVIVAAFCGLRSSEIRGLCWKHVDFENSVIKVRQRADINCVIGQPKSRAGVRDIPMSPFVANSLTDHRGERVPNQDELVFNRNGQPLNLTGHILRAHFWKLRKQLGLSFKLHALRHFCASTWIAADFNVKQITTWLGHSSVQMSFERYGHLLPDDDNRHDRMEEIALSVVGGNRGGTQPQK